jgi:predicted DsbA family dithiol-disulfide isomerase
VTTPREPIIMFSDYACPWCYLGRARLARALAEQPRPVTIVPFPLSPDTPVGGRDLAAYLRSKGIDVRAAMARLVPLMQAEGLEYPSEVEGRRQYATARAQELALWTAEHAPARLDALHDRLFRAYQVENLDISDLDVLERVAGEVGLAAADARAALERGEHAEARASAWRMARQAGVTGVPTYVLAGRGVVGAQPVELLREWIASASE